MGGLIKITALLGGASFEREVEEADLDDYLRDHRNLLWVDVTNAGTDERSFLLEHFGFHPLAVEDSARGCERPKLDEYGDYIFATVAEIGLFVGKNYLVTVHAEPVPALDAAFQRFERAGALLSEGVGYLLYLVLDGLVKSYAPVVDKLGEALTEVERDIARGPAEQRIERLLEIRREVFQLKRMLYPTREALAPLLRVERPLLTAAVRVYVQDVYDHVLRLVDMLDVHREMVAGSIEASLAIVSNRLNVTMKRLTVLSAVVGFASCVFGAWGMNVPGVPAATHTYGFMLIVGATSLVVVVTLALGYRKGWL